MKYGYRITEKNLPKKLYEKFEKEVESTKDHPLQNDILQQYAEILSCQFGWVPVTLSLQLV